MRPHRTLVAALALALAGCGGPDTEQPQTQTVTSTITSEALPSASSSPPSASTTADQAAQPPDKGSDIGRVTAWIEAGQAADPRAYQTVHDTRSTPPSSVNIGHGVAFVSPTKKISCVAGRSDSGFDQLSEPLTCLVHLENPPPQPKGMVGQWIGGWVDYTGNAASVGSFHGDPGVFNDGPGKVLEYGQRLSFASGSDQYTCRMDQTGVWCLERSKGTAVLLSDQGVTPYGCLKEIPHREGEGLSYAC